MVNPCEIKKAKGRTICERISELAWVPYLPSLRGLLRLRRWQRDLAHACRQTGAVIATVKPGDAAGVREREKGFTRESRGGFDGW